MPAAELQVSDRVWQGEAGYGTVEAVAFVSQPQVMYNLTVAEAHTYFVGVGRWLVHNCKKIGDRSVADMAGNTSFQPTQDSVDGSYVERFAEAMSKGNFNWNAMKDKVQILRTQDGMFIMQGHHRVLASKLAGVKIPSGAIEYLDVPFGNWTPPSGVKGWSDVRWTGF